MASPLSAVTYERIKASQYMSAVGMVILLWDYILTFPDEVQLIWSAKISMPKVLFLFNRYAVPLAMIIQSHEFSGLAPYLNLTVSVCKVWYSITVAIGMLSIATSNFLILLRLWVLWNRSPRLMLGTLAFFVVTQVVALSLAGYVIYDMLPTLLFDPHLHICIASTKPKLLLLWCPGVAFEFMVFLTTVWNALDRPRSRNAEMTKVMYRDGSMYFIGLFVLRLVNLIVAAVAPASLIFLGVFFIWGITNITLARLIFNLRRLSSPHSTSDAEDEDGMEDGDDEGLEQTELPVLRREGSVRSASDPESQHKEDL